MMFLKQEKGVTLIELIISLMLAAIIGASATGFMLHAMRTSNRIYTRHELLEHARIAMDTLTVHVLEAEQMQFQHNNRRLNLRIWYHPRDWRPPYLRTYTFEYLQHARRLNFGGNEVSLHLEELTMEVVDGLLEIYIRTADNIGMGVYVEPISLRRVVDVRFKKDWQND